MRRQSKYVGERMGGEKVETIPEDSSWEKFYSEEEKVSGMASGRAHKIKDIFLFVLLNICDIKHVFLLMLI